MTITEGSSGRMSHCSVRWLWFKAHCEQLCLWWHSLPTHTHCTPLLQSPGRLNLSPSTRWWQNEYQLSGWIITTCKWWWWTSWMVPAYQWTHSPSRLTWSEGWHGVHSSDKLSRCLGLNINVNSLCVVSALVHSQVLNISRVYIHAITIMLCYWWPVWLNSRAFARNPKRRGFESRPVRFQVTALGKLLAHMCLCHQAA